MTAHSMFYDELQYHMEEEIFDPETEIIKLNQIIKKIYFVVDGHISVSVHNQEG